MDEISLNTYETTISNLVISFKHVHKLWPPQYKSYTFSISLDIEITALPSEQTCEIKNALALVLNEAVRDVVSIFGWNRVYLMPNAESIIETDLEIALNTLLASYFPLGSDANIPAGNFLGGTPPIPAIPGVTDDCCE